MIDNMTLSTSEHMEQFYDAARWFVANQNITSGGWPNPVRRKVASGMAILEPGWYHSAYFYIYTCNCKINLLYNLLSFHYRVSRSSC